MSLITYVRKKTPLVFFEGLADDILEHKSVVFTDSFLLEEILTNNSQKTIENRVQHKK